MDFIDPVDTPSNNKTNEAVTKLEDDIGHAYDEVEKRVASLWLTASKNAGEIQEKLRLDERRKELGDQLAKARESIGSEDTIKTIEKQLGDMGGQLKALEKSLEKRVNLQSITTQASSALDTLDLKLELVEKQAGKYVSLFASFFSNIISVEPEPEHKKEPETLFSSEAYGTSRYDTDLFKLHTSEGTFLEQVDGDGEFDVEAKTSEVSALLAKYPDTLEKLMNELVPVKVSYNLFWARYFIAEDKLKRSEQQRRELLKKDDDEGFDWDDDDDDAVDVGHPKERNAKSDDDDDWE